MYMYIYTHPNAGVAAFPGVQIGIRIGLHVYIFIYMYMCIYTHTLYMHTP